MERELDGSVKLTWRGCQLLSGRTYLGSVTPRGRSYVAWLATPPETGRDVGEYQSEQTGRESLESAARIAIAEGGL